MADSKKFDVLYNQGLSLLQSTNYQEAAEKLEEAAGLNPQSAEVLDAWGIALTQLQEYPAALKKFEEAVKLAPENARILDNWGFSLMEKGDYQAALPKFIKAVELDPSLNIAFVDWATVLVKMNAGEARLKTWFKKVIEVHTAPEAYRLLIEIGDLLAKEGRFDKSVMAYKNAIELEAEWEEAYHHWLQALGNRDFVESDLQDFQRVADRHQLPGVLLGLGNFLTRQKNHDQALALFDQVEKLDPNFADLDFSVAQTYMAKGDYEAAAVRLSQSLKRDPDDSQAQLLYGQCLALRKEYNDAITEYRAVISRDKQNARAYELWRAAILEMPSPDRQLVLYEKEAITNLDAAEASHQVGNLYLAAGKHQKAISWFRKALEAKADLWPAYTDWGKSIVGLSDTRRLRELEQLEKKILAHHCNADGYNVLGNAFFAVEMYPEAIERYRRAVEDNPHYSYAYYNWGLSLLRQEKYDQAIEQYRRALNADPAYALAYNGWGEALHALQKHEEAIEKFELAAEFNPANEETYRHWGYAAAKLENPDPALKKLEKALTTNMTTAPPFLRLGVVFSDLNRYDDAIRMYQQSLKIDPEYALAYYNWGVALELKEQPEAAVDTYLKSLKLDPSHDDTYGNIAKQMLLLDHPDELLEEFKQLVEKYDRTRGYLELGNTMVELRRLESSISYYQKVIEREPENHWALRNWGMALSGLRRYREAITRFEAATTHKPDFGWGYLDWGIALDAIGKHEEAIEKYQQAIEADPSDPYAYENCGIALANVHRYEDAIKKYNEALEVNPKFISSLFRKGNAYLDLLRYDEAIAAYQETLATADADYTLKTYSSHNIAHIWERRAQYRTARKSWQETAGLYRQYANAAMNRRDAWHFLFYGSIYQFGLDDSQKAEELYQQGLALDPEMAEIMINLLQLFLERKHKEIGRDDAAEKARNEAHWKAWEMFRRACRCIDSQLEEGRSNALLLQKSKLFRLMNRYDEAGKLLEESLGKDCENSDALMEQGVIRMRQENPQMAVKSFQQALDIDPDDLNLRSNLAEAHLKAGDKQRAETLYREILTISADHVDSLMGLGEVYTALGEDALQRDARGDADEYFHQALHFYAEAIERGVNKADSASKKLTAAEKSALHYARGYTRVKLFESKRQKDDDELETAIRDFKLVKANTANYYKAQRAARKIDERLQKHRELSAARGPRTIFYLALAIFLLAQVGFYFGKPAYSEKEAVFSDEMLRSTEVAITSDSLRQVVETLVGQHYGNGGKLLDAVRKAGGPLVAEAVRKSDDFGDIGTLEWQGLSPIDATAYGLLTFGALIFMVAGLYLQEISRLKFGAIELEKSSVDQISSSFSFGITRGSLGKTSS